MAEIDPTNDTARDACDSVIRPLDVEALREQFQTAQPFPFFTIDGPWYGPVVIKLMFPTLRGKMRQLMNINDGAVVDSLEILDGAVAKVLARLEGKEYLVGDQFSRADLAVAALLAPLAAPTKYGLAWPERFPESVQTLMERYPEAMRWTQRMYDLHR